MASASAKTRSCTAAAASAKSLQSCPTLCDPIDSSPPGSPVPGILQARTLEWVAISFSNVWKWKVKVKSLSHVRLFLTLWTAAYQAAPSMGVSRQEYQSGVPLPSPRSCTRSYQFSYPEATKRRRLNKDLKFHALVPVTLWSYPWSNQMDKVVDLFMI